MLSSLPNADWLLGDKGYDADWFGEALHDKRIKPCIPSAIALAATVMFWR